MHFAEILVIPRRLPTFVVITTVNFTFLRLILAEIEALHGEHFRTNRELKIFVRNFIVAIEIKLGEYLVKLLIGNIHAPEFKIKFKFFSANLSCFFDVQIHKCFSHSLPLKLYFLYDFLFNITSEQNFLCGILVVILLIFYLLFLVHLILRILFWIMSEIESLGHVNGITQPFWKVRVIDFTLLFWVLVDHELLQLVIV